MDGTRGGPFAENHPARALNRRASFRHYRCRPSCLLLNEEHEPDAGTGRRELEVVAGVAGPHLPVEAGERLARPVAWCSGDAPRHIEQPSDTASLVKTDYYNLTFAAIQMLKLRGRDCPVVG